MSKEKSLHFLLFLRSTTKKQPPWDAETDCMSVQLRPPGSSFFLLRDIYPGKIMLAHISLALSVGRSSTGSSFLLQSSRCFLLARANDASDREEKSANRLLYRCHHPKSSSRIAFSHATSRQNIHH